MLHSNRSTVQRFKFLSAVVFGAAISTAAGGATITFNDTTFAPSDWSLNVQTVANTQFGIAGSATAAQNTSSGNPADSRQVDISVNSGSFNQVYAFSLSSLAEYTPSTDGAINSVSYSEDVNAFAPAGQQLGPALLQGGILYYDPIRYGPTAGWTTATAASLTASSFQANLPSTIPNFTSTGDPIEFGFVSINNTGNNGFAFNSTALYDNWSIQLATTAAAPEPTGAAGLLAMVSLLQRRRLRQRRLRSR